MNRSASGAAIRANGGLRGSFLFTRSFSDAPPASRASGEQVSTTRKRVGFEWVAQRADVPQGDHATDRTVRLCTPSSSATVTHAPPAAREGAHRRAVRSEEHVARNRPCGSHATHHARSVCPSSVASSVMDTEDAPERSDVEGSASMSAGSFSETPPLPRNDSIVPRARQTVSANVYDRRRRRHYRI